MQTFESQGSGNDSDFDPTGRGRGWTRSRWWVLGISFAGLVLLVGFAFVMAYFYSEKVDSVTIRFVGPGNEIRDTRLPLRPEKEQLPDYKLKIECDTKGFWIFHGKTLTCGPISDTSAIQPLQFRFSDDVALDKVRQMTLIEDDPLDDDILCTVQVNDANLHEAGYDFRLSTANSMRFGFERIWEGNLGLALVFGLLMLFLFFLDTLFFFKLPDLLKTRAI